MVFIHDNTHTHTHTHTHTRKTSPAPVSPLADGLGLLHGVTGCQDVGRFKGHHGLHLQDGGVGQRVIHAVFGPVPRKGSYIMFRTWCMIWFRGVYLCVFFFFNLFVTLTKCSRSVFCTSKHSLLIVLFWSLIWKSTKPVEKNGWCVYLYASNYVFSLNTIALILIFTWLHDYMITPWESALMLIWTNQ